MGGGVIAKGEGKVAVRAAAYKRTNYSYLKIVHQTINKESLKVKSTVNISVQL